MIKLNVYFWQKTFMKRLTQSKINKWKNDT